MADETPVSPLITYLRDGETLLWTGQLDSACYQVKSTREVKLVLGGGGAIICIGGLAFLAMDGINTANVFSTAVGGILLLGSLGIRNRLNVPGWWFAVTDQRVLSNYPTDDAEVIWQLALKDISSIGLKKHEAGHGTISFDSLFRSHVPFECIEEAETVCALINDARRQLGPFPNFR